MIVDEIDVTESQQHVSVLVEALVDSNVESDDVTILGGSVTKDAKAAARGRMSLTLPPLEELIPTMPTDLLAPYKTELRISRGRERNGVIELVRLGVFPLDTASISEDASGVAFSVDGNDRAGRMIEAVFEEAGTITSGTPADEAILDVLSAVDPTLDYDFAATEITLPALVYDEGEDRWAFAMGIAQAIGGELYYSAEGVLTLRPVPSTSGDAVADILGGDGGTLLDISRNWDRSRVYNRVVVTGDNLEAGTTPRGVAVDDDPSSPTRYGGPFGRRTFAWQNSFISTATQAEDAAEGILRRTIGVPDSVSFGAIVDPAREPSDIVYVERGVLGIAAKHILDSVDIPLTVDGTMSAETRTVEPVG